MLKPTKLVIPQGRTFGQVVRWETEPYLFAKIATIENVAPVRVTTVDPHGIPPGWRVAVVDAVGLEELNAKTNPPKDKDLRRATVVDTTHIEFNPLSGALYGKHKAGSGYLQWFSPHSLAGYEARMDIRDKAGGALQLTLSTTNGRVVLDDFEKTILLQLEYADTEVLDWTKPKVYDLELVSPTGVITAILTGSIELGPLEITTTT